MIGVILLVSILAIIGIGLGIWFYKAMSPKQVGWEARIWILGSTGNDNLADMIPYDKDYIIQQQADINIKRYFLQKLKLEVPEVTPKYIKTFGLTKIVDVLYHDGRATLLDSACRYTKDNIKNVLTPINYDVFTQTGLQKNQRLRRLQDDKNPFEAIAKWIGIIIISLVFIASIYVMMDGMVRISANNREASKIQSEAQLEASRIMGDLYKTLNQGDVIEINQPKQPTEPINPETTPTIS